MILPAQEVLSHLLIAPNDHNQLAFGVSLFLFTFMFLPTLFVLVAVIIFFLFYYPRWIKP